MSFGVIAESVGTRKFLRQPYFCKCVDTLSIQRPDVQLSGNRIQARYHEGTLKRRWLILKELKAPGRYHVCMVGSRDLRGRRTIHGRLSFP